MDRDTDVAAGQRTFTAFLFLNDEFEGGETEFPLLNLTVTPKKGMMAFWRNTDHDDNRVDPRTLHRGRAVRSGEKLACNLWVLQKRFEVYRTTSR